MKALLVILSVIGAVLAVALALLLIWRVLATIQVRMLYILYIYTAGGHMQKRVQKRGEEINPFRSPKFCQNLFLSLPFAQIPDPFPLFAYDFHSQ